MPAINDSSAILNQDRVLAQHQAALTVLQRHVAGPSVEKVRWLDIACGRGQILAALGSGMAGEARKKIAYHAYDVDQGYVREAEQAAQALGLDSVASHVGDISDLGKLVGGVERFDFITLTNTVHEVAPGGLARLLVEAILRLAPNGTVFVYDMERISPPELGALPWRGEHFSEIVRSALSGFGESAYGPSVGRWQHKTVVGWNIQIQREHISLSDGELAQSAEAAVDATASIIRTTLAQRLDLCRKSLETLTSYGAQTAVEAANKEDLLYEHWALCRAIGSVDE